MLCNSVRTQPARLFLGPSSGRTTGCIAAHSWITKEAADQAAPERPCSVLHAPPASPDRAHVAPREQQREDHGPHQ